MSKEYFSSDELEGISKGKFDRKKVLRNLLRIKKTEAQLKEEDRKLLAYAIWAIRNERLLTKEKKESLPSILWAFSATPEQADKHWNEQRKKAWKDMLRKGLYFFPQWERVKRELMPEAEAEEDVELLQAIKRADAEINSFESGRYTEELNRLSQLVDMLGGHKEMLLTPKEEQILIRAKQIREEFLARHPEADDIDRRNITKNAFASACMELGDETYHSKLDSDIRKMVSEM